MSTHAPSRAEMLLDNLVACFALLIMLASAALVVFTAWHLSVAAFTHLAALWHQLATALDT